MLQSDLYGLCEENLQTRDGKQLYHHSFAKLVWMPQFVEGLPYKTLLLSANRSAERSGG